MLQVYWRNAGRWRLTAENEDPDWARQAVQVWKEVVLEKTGEAVRESQSLFVTELRLRALAASCDRPGAFRRTAQQLADAPAACDRRWAGRLASAIAAARAAS
jgi:hypothetical protein